ncbi:hypothetical protein MNB_SV-13-1905 [hydrothermal vent metagenome]|uniref:Porin opacity type domain-containing protein n=1 Tax=hydrothermal vent metagenome TaxID=652676 RepID=A0A1W1D148_9ZZZZ
MARLLILFAFLFQSVEAKQETYPFFGISTSLHTMEFKPIVTEAPNRLQLTDTESIKAFGIKYGMQTQDYRTTLSYEASSEFQNLDVSVDYIVMDSMFGTAKVRPYVGMTLGYILYDKSRIVEYNENRITANENEGTSTTISTSDGYYGFDAGFVFYISDDVDLNIGYHYYFMDRLEPLDAMHGFTFSLHYFY